MGYDLHITRRENWADNGNDITANEWLEYIKNDTELKHINENGTYFVIWNGKSKLEEPWFDWNDGQIFTKNPDKSLVDKMIEIANALKASVQGDEGEIYENSENVPDMKTQIPIKNDILNQIINHGLENQRKAGLIIDNKKSIIGKIFKKK